MSLVDKDVPVSELPDEPATVPTGASDPEEIAGTPAPVVDLPLEPQAKSLEAWHRWLVVLRRENKVPHRIKHYRVGSDSFFDDHRYHHVAVSVQKNGDCHIGVACLSDQDQYCKRTGRTIAIGRALKAAAIGRPRFNIGNALEFTQEVNIHRAVWCELDKLKLTSHWTYKGEYDTPVAVIEQRYQYSECDINEGDDSTDDS